MTGAIVLAGGASRRMGTDKALTDWNGEPLLLHVVRVVRSVVDRVVVASGDGKRYPWPELDQAPDVVPNAGPLAGIQAGLITLGSGRHVVVGCDMPCVRPELLRLLIANATDHFDAVVPIVNGKRQPLCAVYDHATAAKMARYLGEGARSVQGLLDRLNVKYLDEAALRTVDPALQSFLNVNSPADLDSLRLELA